ncbi:enoyl-CoA hydratase-related protein [Primorskyibacter sedentarius]|uniref:enoyl-CoA hydratase-related protein n=1 Tax=Primorskyibacter sedentarius TaxID=745311 RepID=UPI003EB7CB40
MTERVTGEVQAMAEAIHYDVTDGVAVLSICHPPVNALAWPVRDGLLRALSQAEGDPEVGAILVAGEGSTFPAGADIAEFDAAPKDPWVPELCTRLENCAKPVVAELHGTVLGGGFELALACHYRVALRATRVGLPEVKLGLIPGAGGTQRTPRMVGVKVALDMILSGRILPIDRPPYSTFADFLVASPNDLRSAALSFCHDVMAKGPRPSRDRQEGFADPVATQTELRSRAEEASEGPENAPREAVAAVEAAFLLPFEAGCAFEEAAFAELVASDQSKALRYAFFAERRAAKVPLTAAAPLPRIGALAVLGAGALASQLVVAALDAGLTVRWGIADEAIRDAARAEVEDSLEDAVSDGALSRDVASASLARLTCGATPLMIRDADLVLDASRGSRAETAPDGALRATAPGETVAGVGLRFARPAHLSRLVEVLEAPQAGADQLPLALALVKRLGKVPVHVRSDGVTVGGKMTRALHRAADALVDLGASPYDIDAVLSDWGLELPPFLQRDATGLKGVGTEERPGGGRDWAAVIAQAGRSGRAAGRGFYNYRGDAGAPVADPLVLEMIERARGDAPGLAKQAIVPLMLGALANEGVRLVDRGIVARASDIDVVMMLGHQFPRWRGGPMKAAELHGLFRVIRAMEAIDHPDRAFWAPEPWLKALVRDGVGIETLSA